jgi:protein pelota
MRIQNRTTLDDGRTRLTVVPESTDDLWDLSHVVEPGDVVHGDTTRRQRRDDEVRDSGGQREAMRIGLRVADIEFDRFADRLRIGGEIIHASQEDAVGHHHTLNVEPRAEVDLETRLKADQDDRLERAVEGTDRPDVAIATVEEGAVAIHTVAAHGTNEYAAFSGTTGKGDDANDRTNLFAALANALEHLDPDAVILAGPGFTKQDARDVVVDRAPDLADRIRTVDTGAAGERGVHEVLARGAVDDVREETRIAREAELVDELTDRLATGDLVAYGPGPVSEAAELGAVDHLLVLDEALRRERAARGDRTDRQWSVDADDIIESVEQQGGDVTVFSSEFDPGEQLRNLGEIAALLRYRVE